ncbi:amino acid transporter [Candidatus Micrarchaeota archaeon CG10_big_fil_rev_8_21_14_0_10_59_7]|nr:MAG: amino acid transporter [Candidatus Micrarchaeota archaeon CG10_big_fil_rev_8_21_14_0_10_59_7]
MALKRELGVFQATMLGIGIIVGAGIYVLVGVAAQETGKALWLSFAIAGVLAALTALTYAELGSRYPRAGSSYYFAKHAFGSKPLSFMLGWILVVASIATCAAVALGFAAYLSGFVALPAWAGALALLALLFAVNAIGIRQASELNMVCTLAEVSGLLLVICLAFAFASPSVSLELPSTGWEGVLGAATLVFFAYLGFETLAAEAEEMRDAHRTLPKAILLSLAVCAVLYVLVAVAYTALVPENEAAEATEKGALAFAAGRAGGEWVVRLLGGIALFATANTALVSLLGASRTMYGMARDKALPRALAETRRAVPLNAVAVSTAAAALLALTGNIMLIAEAGVLAMFVVFIMDNAALVVLRRREPPPGTIFRAPFSVGRVPVTAVLAAFFCVLLMLHEFWRNPVLMLAVAGMIALGFVVYEAEKHVL